ncbi:Kelch repeat-containing protein [Mucilaginibacter auburnensis]|uniref:Kelch motif protein n=1 Tax=Mucilaginibacter auburnensis TaxID=1457233 RepID=A0A2H9VM43_9SPHI|nr:IPT/TIG domain-containing protein [Mucilaginibacter auburnensis]PJJ79375.1 Kelch motif protein [Mucilaginibacter auburnensis]
MKHLYYIFALALLTTLNACSNKDTGPTPEPPNSTPILAGFTPASGKAGTTVTITGANFGTDANAVTVKFGNAGTVKPKTITASQLTVEVPNDATTGMIAVVVNGTTLTTTSSFTVEQSTQTLVYSRTINLPSAKSYLASAGLDTKLFFVGTNADGMGSTIDMYDTVAKAWTTEPMPIPRVKLAAAAAGNKVIFGGGDAANGSSDALDIYDTNAKTWNHTGKLSQGRYHLAAAAAGNKIIFAGGDNDNAGYVATVDIYNTTNNTWETPTTLKGGVRRKFNGASTGNFIMFAGGEDGTANIASKNVDIYDVSTGAWTLSTMPKATYGFTGIGAADKIVFAKGGGINGESPIIGNASTTPVWSNFTPPHSYYVTASAGNFMIFAGTKTVDIYNAVTGTWQSLTPTSNLEYMYAASTGKTIMLIGRPFGTTGSAVTADIFTLVTK